MIQKNSNKTSLIIHGHFYQPPRENPKTDIIPLQSSAFPFHDWNEKIYDCCYGANLNSRFLDKEGHIISLTNNYEYISFNFGPTLLKWLDKFHPECVIGLREADKASIKRLGHGNAMAQSFNHTILPLDSIDNASLQIDWGIKDFIYHYKREPEGMWLPECAINEDIVQLLYDSGITFVVLSPWQCDSIENEEGKIVSLSNNPAPFTEPYLLQGSNGGEISAFFYEPNLASSISFGHALRDADKLYSTLLSFRKDNQNLPLLHTATDGEIYGHHEPFGDMALAALINKVNNRDDFILSNYASFLEHNKAKRHAVLKKGEENKGSSWSCSHGVSRWYKDCGCHTGGSDNWNQKWRVGLRNALNNLDKELSKIFNTEVKRIFNNSIEPLELLRKAGSVFCGEITMKEFIKGLNKNGDLSHEDEVILSHLLTGIKFKHFSFTSCGFFFSDISGIEPRQDIKYALYAISLLQFFSDKELMIPFLNDLKEAKSNIREIGDGMLIAQQEFQGLSGEVEAALYFYLNMELATTEGWKTRYGNYYLSSIETTDKNERQMLIIDTLTDEEFLFRLLPSLDIEKGINLYLTKVTISGIKSENYHITNQDIPERIIDEAYSWIDAKMIGLDDTVIMERVKGVKMYAMLLNNSKKQKLDSRLIENLGEALRCARSLAYSSFSLSQTERISIIKDLIIFILKYGRESEKKVVDEIINICLSKISNLLKAQPLDEKTALLIIDTISSIREIGKEPNLKEIQNTTYDYYRGIKKVDFDPIVLKEMLRILNFHY